MYILNLPSRTKEYGCLTGTGRIAATFEDPKRAQQHCEKMDPSWRVVEMTHSYKEYGSSSKASKPALSLVA